MVKQLENGRALNKIIQLILSSVLCFIAGAGLSYLMLAPGSDQKEDLKQFRKTISTNSTEEIKTSAETLPVDSKTKEPPLSKAQTNKSELQMSHEEYVALKQRIDEYDQGVFSMTNSFFNKANPEDPIWKSILQDRLQRADAFLKNGNAIYKTTFKFSEETLIYFFAEYLREGEKIVYRINFFYVDNGIIEGQTFSYDVASALLIDNELYMEVAIRYSTLFEASGVTTIFLPLPDSPENAYVLKIKDRKIVRTKDQLIEWIPSNKKEEETFFKYMTEKYNTPINPGARK